MIYGFDNNNNDQNRDELISIIMSVVVVVVGILCVITGKNYYNNISPIIETLPVGFLGTFILKGIFIFLLAIIFGIIHTAATIKIMEFVKKVFF